MKSNCQTSWTWETADLVADFEVYGQLTPGDPGCRYTKNGDGWPPSPATVEIVEAKLLKVHDICPEYTTVRTQFTKIERLKIEATFEGWLDTYPKEREMIEEALFADHAARQDAAKEAAAEHRAEMRRERKESC